MHETNQLKVKIHVNFSKVQKKENTNVTTVIRMIVEIFVNCYKKYMKTVRNTRY